jgi:hypothetical protein
MIRLIQSDYESRLRRPADAAADCRHDPRARYHVWSTAEHEPDLHEPRSFTFDALDMPMTCRVIHICAVSRNTGRCCPQASLSE